MPGDAAQLGGGGNPPRVITSAPPGIGGYLSPRFPHPNQPDARSGITPISAVQELGSRKRFEFYTDRQAL